jgi:hypothetical protein
VGILSLLLLLALVIWLWQSNMSAHEAAAAAARDTCNRQGLQLLDGTVHLQRMRLARNESGSATIKRVFQFCYSPEGATRQYGFVITLGNQVDNIGL